MDSRGCYKIMQGWKIQSKCRIDQRNVMVYDHLSGFRFHNATKVYKNEHLLSFSIVPKENVHKLYEKFIKMLLVFPITLSAKGWIFLYILQPKQVTTN